MTLQLRDISLFIFVVMYSFSVNAQWTNGTFAGNVVNFQPTTSGGSFLMNFNSRVNSGSDKAFILFQDESSLLPGTSLEDVRFTIGVFNDFRSNTSHSDELWFQGGGRLVQNVGSWDAEYISLIGTPGVGTTGGFEWRVNNFRKMSLNHEGVLELSKTGNWSYLSFAAQTNDPGTIAHYENNNSAQLWINPSDDFDVASPDDYFIVGDHLTDTKRFWVRGDGNTYVGGRLGIGTTTPSERLEVNGTIRSKEVKVEAAPWPDYVFSEDYDIKSLDVIEAFIKENHRLPKMPSAEEVVENGIALGEMNRLLLEKVEELTLHLIQLKNENEIQNQALADQMKLIKKLLGI